MEIAKKILVIITSGVIGACLMLVYSERFGGSSNYHILYVAEDELMSLEEERVKNEDPSLRQLFFGEIEKAVSLAVMWSRHQHRTVQYCWIHIHRYLWQKLFGVSISIVTILQLDSCTWH